VGDPKAKLRRELPYRLEHGSPVSFGEMDFRERARQDTGSILTRSACVTNKTRSDQTYVRPTNLV
jgi:hypothetical protein